MKNKIRFQTKIFWYKIIGNKIGVGGTIVMKFLSSFMKKRYHLYIDKWHITPALFEIFALKYNSSTWNNENK